MSEVNQCGSQECKPPYMKYDESINRMARCGCGKAEAAQLASLKRISKIPDRYQRPIRLEKTDSVTIATVEMNKILETFPKCRGLYFYGQKGSGKTTLATMLALKIIEKHRVKALYIKTERDFLSAIRDTFNNEQAPKSEKEIFDNISTVPFLILDDFGVEKETEWVAKTLYDLIDYRSEHELVTVFTSNLKLEEFKNFDRGRIWSRISEMCVEIEVSEKDYREEKRMVA